MSMKVNFVFIALLLLVSLAHAGRPEPVDLKKSSTQGVEKDQIAAERVEGCDGVGEDECLMRRTLAAHTDYIYTQEHHH